MNPLVNILISMLGREAMKSFMGGGRPGGAGAPGGWDPFQGMYGQQQPQSDDPIDVEVEIADEDGKTDSDRAREQWDSQVKADTERPALGGKATPKWRLKGGACGPLPYIGELVVAAAVGVAYVLLAGWSVPVGIALGLLVFGTLDEMRSHQMMIPVAALLLVASLGARVYALYLGHVFSWTVIPAAAGLIIGALLTLIGAGLIFKFGEKKMNLRKSEIVYLFPLGELCAYLMPVSFLIAFGLGMLITRKTKLERFPVIPVWCLLVLVQGLTFGFPGLV